MGVRCRGQRQFAYRGTEVEVSAGFANRWPAAAQRRCLLCTERSSTCRTKSWKTSALALTREMRPLTDPHPPCAGSAPSPRPSSDTSAALKALPTPSQASPNTFASRRPLSSRASLDWSALSTRPTEMGKNDAVDLLFTSSGLMARAELTNETTDLERNDCLRCSCPRTLMSCPSGRPWS